VAEEERPVSGGRYEGRSVTRTLTRKPGPLARPETLRTLERWGIQTDMEGTVKDWLRATIKRMEQERAEPKPATSPTGGL
jgi:hypothetical protein